MIKYEDFVKILGVTIDFQLNFNVHISNICKMASTQLNVLTRIGDLDVNYCPLTWHFCGEANTRTKKFRFIYRDYSSSYESLLT